jgi:hypothetical protein
MGREARAKKKKLVKANIMVGMPIHKYMEPLTMVSWDNTVAYYADKPIGINRWGTVGIPYVDTARNKCVDYFLEHPEFSHLMWIDDDMVWEPSAIEKLVNYNVPVVSALVTLKSPPFRVTLIEFAMDESGMLDSFEISMGRYPLDKPFEIPNSCIGTAFMLIKREVIEKMEPPYFTGFVNKRGVLKGTDLYFGARINRYGYKFLYDPTIRVYHVGRGIYGVEDHIAYLEQEKKGITSCLFSSSSADNVENYKRSFAGPQPSLIASHAPVVEQQLKKLACLAESKSET